MQLAVSHDGLQTVDPKRKKREQKNGRYIYISVDVCRKYFTKKLLPSCLHNKNRFYFYTIHQAFANEARQVQRPESYSSGKGKKQWKQ